MPKMRVWVQTNKIGSDSSTEYDVEWGELEWPKIVEDDAQETMFDMIEWGFTLYDDDGNELPDTTDKNYQEVIRKKTDEAD